MIDLSEEEESRVYTINLSKVWLTPRIRRAKRAINMIREFAERHMKSEDVKIDQSLNEAMWERGIRHPPRKIRVRMVKDEDDVVTVSLYSEEVKEEEMVEEKAMVEAAAPTAATAVPAAEEALKEPEATPVEPEEIAAPEPEKIEAPVEEEEKPKKKEEPEKIVLSEEELAEILAEEAGEVEPEEEKPKLKGRKAKKEDSEE